MTTWLNPIQFWGDYHHTIVAQRQENSHTIYTIESVAKENAPVVWGKQVLTVRDDYLLLREKFFDEDMVLVKDMTAENLTEFSGRIFPKTWTMRRADKEDHYTKLEYVDLEFDLEIEDRVFTLASLKSKKRVR